MVRPTIARTNLQRGYLARARGLAREWSLRYPGVEAIMLTGGVSRGYADEESELDLTLFLKPSLFREWVIRCQAPMPEGDNLIDGTYVDLSFASIDRERRAPWEPLKIWDATWAKVLLDREGRLAALLKEKVRPLRDSRSLAHQLIETRWYVEMGEQWIGRTDPLAGHHLLNLALDRFLGILFYAQGEIAPFDKWRLNLSRTLPRLPEGYEEGIRQWLLVRDFTEADVRRRAKQAWALLRWWEGAFPSAWRHSLTWEVIRALRRGPIELEDFQRHFDSRCLLEFPLRAVAQVRGARGRWMVALDPARLQNVLAEGAPGMLPYQLERLRNAAR